MKMKATTVKVTVSLGTSSRSNCESLTLTGTPLLVETGTAAATDKSVLIESSVNGSTLNLYSLRDNIDGVKDERLVMKFERSTDGGTSFEDLGCCVAERIMKETYVNLFNEVFSKVAATIPDVILCDKDLDTDL